MIGVNDQYSGHDINTYPANFTILLNKALLYATSKENVIVLSIPDYSVTPFGGNSIKTAMEIAAYNKINKTISDEMDIKYVNITTISLKAKDDLSYLANDKLHPSEKMYSEWVAEMYDEVLLALNK
ncbi:MAG: hypothetical protein IPO92_03200 [Saprospiraceae bacterium]|nr:hypothetical protein [Saprospiraceae bacterium]